MKLNFNYVYVSSTDECLIYFSIYRP